MPFLYFKHIIYKIFGETSLKNVNSRDSYRFFWQLDSQNLILDTRSSVTGNFKIKEYKKKQEKRECTLCLGGRVCPFGIRNLCFPTK